MNRTLSNATRISAAIGLAMGLQMAPAFADDMQKGDMAKPAMNDGKTAMNEKMEKCYGVNATGKNDCAEGAHSCAGQATRARDPKSFVLLPNGACKKIEGGKTSAT